jgi:hypothetical protein
LLAQPELVKLAPYATFGKLQPYTVDETHKDTYGLTRGIDTGHAYIDGACGEQAVARIIRACGWKMHVYHATKNADVVLIRKEATETKRAKRA